MWQTEDRNFTLKFHKPSQDGSNRKLTVFFKFFAIPVFLQRYGGCIESPSRNATS